jgi:hypothetical protein
LKIVLKLKIENYDPVVELGVAQVTVREVIHQVHYGVHPVSENGIE